jgi:hypothetical protein
MYVLLILSLILGPAVLILVGILTLLRDSLDSSPYAVPVAPIADAAESPGSAEEASSVAGGQHQ